MGSTPSDCWFCLTGERPIGPLSAEQLRAAACAGVVRPETMVRNAGWSHWCRADQVPGVFPSRLAVPPERSVATPPADPSPATESRSPPLPPPPPERKHAAEPAAPPPPPEPPVEFSILVAGADRPKKAPRAKRSKRNPSIAIFLGLLAALAVCVALVVAKLNTPPSAPTPARPPVAQVPKKSAADESRERGNQGEADDGDSRGAQWGLDSLPEAGHNPATLELAGPATPRGRLDELVFAKWKQLGIEPANPCSDAVFLRRVYLDVLGTLPTVQEARAFLSDKSPDKRERLIDALLERPEFADFWAMKWSDLLRVKSEFPINLWPNAAQAYHRWIRNSIKNNLPYDKFARELLTSSGSNFRVPQVNFYRALPSKDPKGIARAVALTFMGCRAEKWPEERLAGMSAFFTKVGYKRTGEWKEEIVIFDPQKSDAPPPATQPGAKKAGEKKGAEKKAAEKKVKAAPPPAPVLPDGTPVEIPWDKDPRGVFADWLITPKNPWFARNIVNRVWCWLQGRGIVHEADDVRPDNPPSNPALLDWLAEELVKSNYDLKHIYRLILNSSTYQLSSIPKGKNPEAAAQFASYAVRRLEAEVIIDALNQITGTTESYSSIIPEPYTFIPETRRAIALPDGSITSSFLELFGRPPRDSGLESERNNRITAGQRLHLLNSSHVRNKLRDGPGLRKLLGEGNASENVYLAILSRPPADGEWRSGENLAWTLINSTEFLFRH